MCDDRILIIKKIPKNAYVSVVNEKSEKQNQKLGQFGFWETNLVYMILDQHKFKKLRESQENI